MKPLFPARVRMKGAMLRPSERFIRAGLILLITYSLSLTPLLAQKTVRTGMGGHLVDSFPKTLKNEKEDTNKVNTLLAISAKLRSTSKYDSAMRYANQALTLANTLTFEKGRGYAYWTIGLCYWNESNYSAALTNLREGLSIFQSQRDPFGKTGNKKGESFCLNGIGLCFWNEGNYPGALDYFYKALAISQQTGDKNMSAVALGNIALIYDERRSYTQALEYELKALDLYRASGDKAGEALNLGNIGDIYTEQGNYDKALEYDLKAMYTFQKMENKQNLAANLGNIGDIYSDMGEYAQALEYELDALAINRRIGNKRLCGYDLSTIGQVYTKQKKYALSKSYLDSALFLSKKMGEKQLIKDVYGNRLQLDSAVNDYKAWMFDSKSYSIYRDSLNNEKTVREEMNLEFERKTDSIKAAQDKLNAIASSEIQRQKVILNSFIGGFFIAIMAAALFFFQRKRIAGEKKRSEELLLNILPEEVADELKKNGRAEPKDFDEITVIFTDFKGFTRISEKLTAKELVTEIDCCFKGFDAIIEKHGIEKIKTIGDSYMAAGGLPVVNKTHARDVVNAALDIVKFMENHKQQNMKEGKEVFEIRVGINTGPVVAGIVGVRKFAYDIWGDTVNIASRMESSGEAGKVNISGSTYQLVKNHFTCTHRGKIGAKSKGEVDMYFVEVAR